MRAIKRAVVWIVGLCVMSFAAAATVEIVKKIDVLPKIAIQDASSKTGDIAFRKEF